MATMGHNTEMWFSCDDGDNWKRLNPIDISNPPSISNEALLASLEFISEMIEEEFQSEFHISWETFSDFVGWVVMWDDTFAPIITAGYTDFTEN